MKIVVMRAIYKIEKQMGKMKMNLINISNYGLLISSIGVTDVQDAPIMYIAPRPMENETDVKAPNDPLTTIGAVSLIYLGQYTQKDPAARPYTSLAGNIIQNYSGINVGIKLNPFPRKTNILVIIIPFHLPNRAKGPAESAPDAMPIIKKVFANVATESAL